MNSGVGLSGSDENVATTTGQESGCASGTAKDDASAGQSEASKNTASEDHEDEEGSQDVSAHDEQIGARVSRTENADDDNGCEAPDSEHAQSGVQPSQQADADGDADADDDTPSEGRPTLETQSEHYRDSGHANTSTVTSTATVPFDNFSFTLRKQTVWAHDALGSQRSEATSVSLHRELSEIFAVDGELGSIGTLRRNGLIGSFQAEVNYRDASISGSVGRNLLASSAQTIRANVWQTDFGLSGSYKLTERLSSELEFHHKVYSDRNGYNELEWSPQYLLDLLGSQITSGYRFSYSGFAKNTDNGYWAPQLTLSHNLFANWSYDWTTGYSRLELELGRGSVREAATVSYGYGGSVKAVIGLRPSENTVIEYSLSSDRSPGWNSTSSGFSLKYTF